MARLWELDIVRTALWHNILDIVRAAFGRSGGMSDSWLYGSGHEYFDDLDQSDWEQASAGHKQKTTRRGRKGVPRIFLCTERIALELDLCAHQRVESPPIYTGSAQG